MSCLVGDSSSQAVGSGVTSSIYIRAWAIVCTPSDRIVCRGWAVGGLRVGHRLLTFTRTRVHNSAVHRFGNACLESRLLFVDDAPFRVHCLEVGRCGGAGMRVPHLYIFRVLTTRMRKLGHSWMRRRDGPVLSARARAEIKGWFKERRESWIVISLVYGLLKAIVVFIGPLTSDVVVWDAGCRHKSKLLHHKLSTESNDAQTIIHEASEKRFKNEPDSINKSVSAALCCRVPLWAIDQCFRMWYCAI